MERIHNSINTHTHTHTHTHTQLNNPDNHDGVVIHSESGILECEVKWTL